MGVRRGRWFESKMRVMGMRSNLYLVLPLNARPCDKRLSGHSFPAQLGGSLRQKRKTGDYQFSL